MSLGYLPGAHVPSCPVHRASGRSAVAGQAPESQGQKSVSKK